MTNQSTGSASRGPFACLSLSFENSLKSRSKTSRRGLARARGVVALVAALVLTCAVGAFAQAPILQPSWNQLSPPTVPPERFGPALAYDAAHSQVVMFGGFGHNNVINDTWLWNGTNWTRVFPANSPSARNSANMVYDAAIGKVVLFGGSDSSSTRLNDTWTWDGTNWTNLIPASNPPTAGSPPGRNGAAMAYDAAHGQVVLFGGISTGGTTLGDTWLWSGSTWTQVPNLLLVFPPSARFGSMMTYDAAMGEVILFGGNDGQEKNDTWAWNGTSWTNITPSSNPTARDSGAIAYDDALGQIVLFGGESAINGPYLNDTWIWNGSTWTEQTTTAAVPGVRQANAMAYDAAQQQVIMFGGLNGGFNHNFDTWAWGLPQNFGNINVCPSGQSTPAPCSTTLALTFNFPVTTNINSINVVTQGATGLDFTQANGGNCSGQITAGSSCTMDVAFTPLVSGLRTGAVQLTINSGGPSQLVSSPIYGVGQGAVAVFTPLSTLVESAGPLTGPKGVVVDAAGDLFVSDYEGHKVVELGPSTNNQIVTIAQAPQISDPQGLAMDGAGNLYVADTGLSGVVKIPWGCTNSTCQQTVPNPLNLSGQFGVSVDPQGDLFVSAYNQGEVVEVPVNGGAQTPVYNGNTPIGTAVDAAGDLFVADAGGAAVMKVPAGCTNSGCYVQIGSNWATPQAVSLDAAGDLYVTDSNLRTVVEFPSGCTSNNCDITIANAAETSLGTGFQPWDAVPDGQGNIYIADHGLQRVDAILQQIAGLNFSASTVNNISGDSPQSVLFQNIGNQTLTAAGQGLVFSGPNFTQVAGPGSLADCTSTFSLAPGAPCNLSVQFDPLSAGSLTGNAIFYDNALNNPASSQSIPFTGTGLASVPSYTLAVSDLGSGAGTVTDQFSAISCSVPVGNNTACSASYQSGTPITLTATPSAGASFLGWGGACSSFGTSPQCTLTMNSAMNVSASFGTASFGNINVCLSGGPAPCNTTMPVIFNFTASSTTVGSAKVVTQGVSNLDFTLANTAGSNCAGNTWTAGTSCTILVTFAPRGPGLRSGAVELFDNSVPAHLVATALISGIGQAPEIVYGPAFSGATILGGPSLENVLTTTGFTPNPRGMTSDASGNLYIADPSNGRLLMRAPNGTTTTVGTLSSPQGVAIDGAGNLFVADTGLREVVEIPAGCTIATCQVPVYASPSANPVAVVVDGPGDLFIADPSAGGVVEVPAGCANSSCYVPIGSGWHSVNTLALDAAGDLFVPDSSAGFVSKMPAGCTTNSCRLAVGPGWIVPQGIAVDAAGDLYVSDTAAAGGLGQVTEVPAGCVSNSCEIALATGTPTSSVFVYDLTVDQLGQVYAADGGNHRILQINQSQPPTESFATTNVGFTSTDSPQSFTLLNAGNQTLNAVLPGFAATGPNFYQVSGSGSPTDCFSNFSLAPGAGCNVGLSFMPQVGGNLTGTATATDNNLNAASATQTFNLSGVAFETAEPLNLTGAGTGTGFVSSIPSGVQCNVIAGVVSSGPGGSCSPSFPGGTGISLQEVPTSGSVFTGWGGACAGQSQTCNITTNIGSPTNVTASFSPVATNFAVTVTEVGTGAGTVSDNQSQISCMRANGATTGTCSASYAGPVILTATPTGNSIFAGWGDACAGSGANLTCSLTVSSPLSVTASFVAPGATQAGSLMPITAGVVYGQGGSFATGDVNHGGVSADSIWLQGNMVVDAGGNLYLADAGNNRVLFYPAGSTTATRVYGQGGSFTSNDLNHGGVGAASLANPQGLALDSSGNLYVADEYNNRVLFYPAGSTTATQVYGQGGSFTTNDINHGGVSANSMNHPFEVAVDINGNLYVADYGNSRVLFYPSGTTTATQVYGQSGSFATVTANTGGVSANSLNQPTGVALDSSGDLYVADLLNNRVLFYPFGNTTATQVYGQGGSFTTNNIGVGANSLNNPLALAVDSSGGLYVADRSNNRVLFYPFGNMTATRVYGQFNNLNSGAANNGGTSANSLSQPFGVTLDHSGNLYVADYGNNRLLEYGTFGNVNVCPAGQNTPAPCNRTVTLSYASSSATILGATQVVTQGTPGLDFTLSSGGSCTGAIGAGSSCIVNVKLAPLAPGLRMGAVTLFDNTGNPVATSPLYGIGQAPLAVFGPGTQIPVSTGTFSLSHPAGVLVDNGGNLFISDVPKKQVLKIASNGVVSSVGFGFQFPQGMAEDGAGDLFVADNNLNEIVEIPSGCASISCQVYLGSNYRSQLGVAVDGAGNVFFGDFLDGEVVEIPAGCTTTACQKVVYSPGQGAQVVDLTLDSLGNLFVADFGRKLVVEVPAGCINSTCQVAIGSGWNQPDGVAVDAAGDVFVADEGLKQIVEVPAGCTTFPCQVVLVNNVDTVAVKVDASGDVFYDNLTTAKIAAVTRSLPPSVNFALTDVGGTSSDSPRPVSVQNIGNQTLTGTSTFNLSAGFSVVSTCGLTLSLPPGAACSENFAFSPPTTGYLTGSAIFHDNTMNLSPAVSLQTINLSGIGGLNGQAVTAAVPNVVGLTQQAAGASLVGAGLITGSVSSASSSIVPAGSVIASNPAAGTQVSLGSPVKLLISTGAGQPTVPNPLSLLNNYFVTGDYAAAGVTLRGAPVVNNMVTGTISIPTSTGPLTNGIPNGADLIDGFLYWTTLESSALPSGSNAIFLGYSISGQQIGSDLPYTDTVAATSGTLRVYRADVNTWFQNGSNGTRTGSGSFTVSLPAGGAKGVLLTEGASLVVIYRVLSPNFPLKAVVIYDGSAIPASSTTQNMQGFYDASGGGNASGNVTTVFVDSSGWNSNTNISALGQSDHYNAPLKAGAAYGAVILSTLVNNHDNDGILDVWKAGPPATDFHGGEPGYYDVKTGAWVGLPGARLGQKDLFVQLDYMCGVVGIDGSCDPSAENLFPSPDSFGNDPLAMVQQAFANSGVALHLQVGNAVPESKCVDSPGQPCQFPGQPGVIGWKNSLEFSKVWPRNFASCVGGGDCSPRFPYGQKDSYHYVLFGHSLAIPAWNTRYQTLTTITAVPGGTTTFVTTDRGAQGSVNYCPSRITVSGIQGMPNLNGVYNTTSCPDSRTIVMATPAGVTTRWSYPNSTLPEPVIGITSGTVTSISGYSDLGGADSAVTLGLWETSTTQDMSTKATVVAGTLFHELGHTIGLGHGGIYYTPNNYVPTFEANCKPNYQSIMNYLFQLDGVGPASAIAFSNQTLTPVTQTSFGSVLKLVDTDPGFVNVAATFPTSTWYTPTAPSPTASPANLHCDGTPLGGEVGYRVTGSIAPTITPAWANGQNITFDGQAYSTLRGFNDISNIDLRQVGATGGQFASLASVLSFDSAATPLNIAPGGSVSVGPGGTVTLGAGGSITVPGGNVTIPTGGTISGGGTITLGAGGNVTLGAGGNTVLTAGSNGIIALPAGGTITLGGGGTITLGGGGNVTLGAGGNVTLGAGGTITLPAGGGTITIPSTGGSYFVPAGGTVTLGGGGNITLGAGGNVTLGAGGNVTLGAGGNVTLGGGGNVTLGAGGTITLGGGGNVTLGAGGNITLGGGGTITLGGGGNVTLGAGGNVTLGAGGTVTLGGGGNITLGGGGNVTLGAGGTVTLGAGGNVTLGAGGTVTLGGGGNVTLGAGGSITLTSAGNVTLGAGGGTINGVQEPAGTYPVGAGGNVTLGAGGNVTLGGGGTVTLGAGGNITLGGGGTVTLGAGGNVTLGAGGNVTLGAGGNVTLGAGGNITLGGGGNVTLGGGGAASTELDYSTANSIVRPPTAPTETSTTQGVVVSWTAPGFGVVDTYTIYRGVNGGTPIVIGSVSGVGGNPPATTFTDTTPPTSGTVVYTITTTLAPDPGTSTQRQSGPSSPAVMTVDQTIVLTPLPSSVPLSSSTLPVSATSGVLSNQTLTPNHQLVNFAASGSCSVGTSSLDSSTGVSSATVKLNSTGSCTITASQPGDSTAIPVVSPAYNAADPVSGTFMIVPQGSNLTAQTITFPQLPNAQYGNTPVPVSATASPSGFTVTLTALGPCTMTAGNKIAITGAGKCTVTATAPSGVASDTKTYSAASATQSFNIAPAVLTVKAGDDLKVAYGQPIQSLTNDFTITGYVNSDNSSVLNNTAPALSTTATSSSIPGSYPITVSTGTLAATNYDFLYVNGTLTVTPTGSVPSSSTTCNGAYNGTFKGSLVISKGQTCIFVGGGTTGTVTDSGGNLVLQGATTGGGVTITSGTFTIGPSAIIKGNLTITNMPRSTATNQVCGSTITSSLVFQGNSAPVLIGSGTPSCAGNIINGSLQVSTNPAAVTVYGNKVSGSVQVQSNSGATIIDGNKVGVSVQVQSNTGATQVFTNIITNALQCQSNSSITGSGNTAPTKQGQCAKF